MIIQCGHATPVDSHGCIGLYMLCTVQSCAPRGPYGLKCNECSTPKLALCRAASTWREEHFLLFVLPEAKAAPCSGGPAIVPSIRGAALTFEQGLILGKVTQGEDICRL